MGEYHTVEQGESLKTIAKRFGFKNYRTIYGDGKNAEFRAKRPIPSLIHPGDRIWIPDKETKEESRSTGRVHRFEVHRPRRRLEIRILDLDDEPIANTPYELYVNNKLVGAGHQTDAKGMLREEIPMEATTGELRIKGYVWSLQLDHLNPVQDAPDEGISGVQGRLRNLGYDPGPIDGKLGPLTRAALAAFQRDYLPGEPSGECDAATIAKLIEMYGC
jgi:hypothetical protein